MNKARAILAALIGGVIVSGALAQSASVPLSPTERRSPLAPASPAVTLHVTSSNGVPQLNGQDVSAWLDGFIPYAIGKSDIPGAVIAIVDDGRFLALKGYGYADLDKKKAIDPRRSLIRPGSVSKLFTWTAVMQLAEQGKLDLNADVNQYLDFNIPELNGQPITLSNIMTHTAGFEEQVKDIITTDGDNVVAYEGLLKRWVPERVYAPGTTPAYSNYATSLAGYIVQRVSGQPLHDYIEANIFKPLGMNNSTFRQPVPDRLKSQLAEGYVSGKDKPYGFEYVGPWPAGSLSSTAEDMGRFMNAHLQNGGAILKPETARLMHSRLNLPLPGLNGMAHGFYEASVNGKRVIAHGGDTVAFHSDLNLFLNDGVGIFVSFNSAGKDGAVGPLRSAIVKEFANRYFPNENKVQKLSDKVAKENAEKLAGVYSTSRRSHSSFLAITDLFSQVKVSVDDDGNPVVPMAQDLSGKPRKWTATGPLSWRDANDDETLGATVSNGTVTRFSLGSLAPIMVWDRVPWHRSSAWLVPLLVASLAVLTLTVLLWPARAIIRRRFGATLPIDKRQLLAFRASRIAATLTIAVVGAWTALISMMFGDLTNLSAKLDPFLYIVQILSFVVFVGGLAAMAWYAVTAWRGGWRWPAKTWSILLVIASASLLYVAVAFNLISWGAAY